MNIDVKRLLRAVFPSLVICLLIFLCVGAAHGAAEQLDEFNKRLPLMGAIMSLCFVITIAILYYVD